MRDWVVERVYSNMRATLDWIGKNDKCNCKWMKNEGKKKLHQTKTQEYQCKMKHHRAHKVKWLHIENEKWDNPNKYLRYKKQIGEKQKTKIINIIIILFDCGFHMWFWAFQCIFITFSNAVAYGWLYLCI